MYFRAIGCLLCAGLLSGCTTGPALEKPARLHGQVLSRSQPVSGVRVRVDGQNPGVVSGADGRYQIANVAPGPRHLVATAGSRTRTVAVRAMPGESVLVPPIELGRADAAGLDALLGALASGPDESAMAQQLRSLQPEVLVRLREAMRDEDLVKAARWLEADGSRLLPNGTKELSIEDLRMALARWRETGDGDMKENVSRALPALSSPRVLYDPAYLTNPGAQGWWFLTDPPLASHAVEAVAPTGVWLDSTVVRAEKAGYATEDPVTADWMRHPNLAQLDVARGFTVQLDLLLAQERHARDDRAGFSIIVVGHDLSAIELGFWKGRVWAQSDRGEPLFRDSRAESAPFRFEGRRVRVELSLLGGRYQLLCDGRPVLSGPLRNYTGFGGYPYDVPDYLFLGDDTGSAKARFQLGRVELLPIGPVAPALLKEAALSDRTVARAVASGTAMTPGEALAWLRQHREAFLHGGGAAGFTAENLDEVLRVAEAACQGGSSPAWNGDHGIPRPASVVSDSRDAVGQFNAPSRVADGE